jgi:hypothetical protein
MTLIKVFRNTGCYNISPVQIKLIQSHLKIRSLKSLLYDNQSKVDEKKVSSSGNPSLGLVAADFLVVDLSRSRSPAYHVFTSGITQIKGGRHLPSLFRFFLV